MDHRIHSEAEFNAALGKLVMQDPRLAPVLEKAGRPSLRQREGGFAGLCAIITSQQLSTASASAIWKRVEAAFMPFHHDRVRRARASTLARLGLSAPKIRTLKAIGTAISKGDINLAALEHMEADEAHNALIALHGIGPWTADIYLLFCLGHADAWPAGDLALQEAARVAFNMRARPTTKKMIAIGDKWRPWRGVAAHLLWKYYHVIKQRDPIPVQPADATKPPDAAPVRKPAQKATKKPAKSPPKKPANKSAKKPAKEAANAG